MRKAEVEEAEMWEKQQEGDAMGEAVGEVTERFVASLSNRRLESPWERQAERLPEVEEAEAGRW
ncbi:hypothetical protein BDZ91DRAFT_797265 [Kalaharituber pfeilii]|nr:hypothetical protein BDZ91DRAFT_797265 [Kalaharituber pfeilii]